MADDTIRWDALTYDGSAPGRRVPSLHIYLKPARRSGSSPAAAQRLFQDLVSRFYSGPPFLTAREKLADAIRYCYEEAVRTGNEEGLGEVHLGVAIVDPGGGEFHVFRQGDVRLLIGDKEKEFAENDELETIDAASFLDFTLLDTEAGEEASRLARLHEPGERVVLGSKTVGIRVSLGEGETRESFGASPRVAPDREQAPLPTPSERSDEARSPVPDRPVPERPVPATENLSIEESGPTRFSLLPFGALLLILLMALFWSFSGRGPEGGDRRQPRFSADDPLPPPPAGTLAWDFRAGGAVTSSPILAGDLVLFGSRGGKLYALDRETGETVWTASGPSGIGSSPAVGEGRVYFGEYGGAVAAVSLDSGTVLWRQETGARIVSSPFFFEGRIYVGSHNRFLYALDAETGDVIWRFLTGGVVWSSPAVTGDLVLFGSWDGILYALDRENGKEAWRYDTGGRVYSSPVVQGNEVYIGTEKGELLRLVTESGDSVWSAAVGGPIHSSPAITDDRVVFGCEDGSVYCVYRETGEILWSFPTGGRVPSSPFARSGIAFVGSYDQFLYAFDLDLGHPVWRVHVGGSVFSSPTAGDQHLYTGTNQGRFLAISLGGGSP